ncbi:MAG: hypothetical protein JOY58_15850 [Solirubrobacterales bacterium]|nr:hypothetical protein [Solirubrobacterales bacterium]
MSPGASDSARSFRAAYASALGNYLLDPSESYLHVAYELGREAVSLELSVLDLAVAHQEAQLAALAGAPGVIEAQRIAQAAGDFFLESLASFEMVQRGFKEARQAVLLERRQIELSRQLSTFLADASLALDASDSLEEMLRLVSEQARELLDADCCVTTVALAGEPRVAEAASYPEGDSRWAKLVRWLDLPATYRLLRANGGSVRMRGEQLRVLPSSGSVIRDGQLREWLAASLTTLDGSELGAIQVFDKARGSFTGEDEAALVHLAQIASAAVERTRLYEKRA